MNAIEMPPDKDYCRDTKTTIARIQMAELINSNHCHCASCHAQAKVTMAYKCRWCGVWYCHKCAEKHFKSDGGNKK